MRPTICATAAAAAALVSAHHHSVAREWMPVLGGGTPDQKPLVPGGPEEKGGLEAPLRDVLDLKSLDLSDGGGGGEKDMDFQSTQGCVTCEVCLSPLFLSAPRRETLVD